MLGRARSHLKMKPLDPKEWPHLIRPGSRVFIGSGAAFPGGLMGSLLSHADALKDVELFHGLTLGPAPWADARFRASFRVNTYFVGPGLRDSVNHAGADYTPMPLSEIPGLFAQGMVPVDVALIAVTPPDASGYCSLGPSVDVVSAAARVARTVIAQVNPLLPRTLGDSFIHQSRISRIMEHSEAPPEVPATPRDSVTARIGAYVAQLIEDGSTLQLGMGKVAAAVCAALAGHRRLGVHTELLTEDLLDLILCGSVDNSCKTSHTGQTVAAMCLGTRRLYAHVNNNPHIAFHPTEYVNAPFTIASQHKMVAINGALQVDLTGQAVADTIGTRLHSGIGGHPDFLRGASLAPGGRAIVCLRSTACRGEVSTIVPALAEGVSVSATRTDVHFVVTEYGVATLRGRSVRERVLELIQVAHPKFRDSLLEEARRRRLVPAYQAVSPIPVTEIGDVESQWVTLKGETCQLRPLHPSDERRLQEFFYSHSPETILRRYGHPVSRMTRERAYHLVSVDQSKDLALAVFEVQGPRQVIHAVGRYFLDANETSGEMAFVVRESKQRHGMCSLLLRHMVEVARKRGLKSLWALCGQDNQPMLHVFHKFGAKLDRDDDERTVRVTLDLSRPLAGEPEVPDLPV